MVTLHVCQVWWTLAYKPLTSTRDITKFVEICGFLVAFPHWGIHLKSDEAFVYFKAVKESWRPSRAKLFYFRQACARIRSSCVASLA